jgi:TPR repeat protein
VRASSIGARRGRQMVADGRAAGNIFAEYDLGQMYYKGLGVRRDVAEAAMWHGKASQFALAWKTQKSKANTCDVFNSLRVFLGHEATR